tara:strand:- start:307 stop:1512 length:1206 start_codon:yes stop_codon:yes gene_type:complete
MNILVTATTFPRWDKDSEPGFVYYLNQELVKKGHKVIALVPHHPGAKTYEEKDGMKIYRFRYFIPSFQRLCYDGGILSNLKSSWLAKLQVPFLVFSEYMAIKRIVKKEKIDAIHAHWIVPQGYLAAKIKKKYNIPFIVTAHAGDVFPLKKEFFRKRAIKALKQCNFCTVNSKATKQAVLNVFEVPNIEIIPMGVDLSKFSSKKVDKRIKKKYGIEGEFLLFVGRLAEKKGIIHLLEAMPVVIKSFPKVKLLIIGDGVLREELENRMLALNIEKNVTFTGKMSNEQLPGFYATADIFVGPSIITDSGDTEGLGVVFLEALASGTVVIGSNVGGIPDIIEDGKSGFLVPQKDSKVLSEKIIALLKNSQLRKDFVNYGKNHIKKNFSWDSVSEKFNELFKSLSR